MTKTQLRMTCALLPLLPVVAFAAEAEAEASKAAAVPLLAAANSAASAASLLHEPEGDLIVVSASPLERPTEDLLSAVSVLEGEELQRQLRGTLGETLAREPGVTNTAYGAGAGRPIIRGLGGERVRTLTNGVGTIDAAALSPDHAVPVEPALAQRIEVVRGSALLRYGSSAAGGVVNVLDGRIPSAVPENGFDAAARAATTTVDDGTEFSGGLQALIGKVGGLDVVLSAQASDRSADDYAIPGAAESEILEAFEEAEGEEHDEEEEGEEGVLENSFNDVTSYAGGLSFIGDSGFLGFSVQRTESQYGIPGGHGHGHGEEEHAGEEEHGEDEEGGVFIDLEQTRYDLNAGLEFGGFIETLNIFAGYADYEHTEFEGPGEPGTVFTNEGWELRAEAVQAERGSWRGATGVQFRSREFSAIGEEAFVPATDTEQFGVFTFQEVDLGNLLLEGAARFESTEHSRSDNGGEFIIASGGVVGEEAAVASRSFDTFSVSGGGRLRLSDAVSVSGQLLRTERAPVTEELFSNGPHLATSLFAIGNQDLDVETATGIEGSIRFATEGASITLTAFATSYDGFIYQTETALTGADVLMFEGEDDEEELEEFGELPIFTYAQDDAMFTGFELEARATLGSIGGVELSGDFVADYVRATLDEADAQGNDNLPRIPPLGIIAGLDADAGPFGFRAEIDYASEAEDTASFELPTEAYTQVNLYADYAITDRVTASVAALNLGDEEVRVHSSFLKDVAPQPGRNIRFALRVAY